MDVGNRVKSVNLMRDLKPFINLGILDAKHAQRIIADYQIGKTDSLDCFVSSKEIPVAYLSLLEPLRNYI